MKRSRFSEGQIIAILKEQESGNSNKPCARKAFINVFESAASLSCW